MFLQYRFYTNIITQFWLHFKGFFITFIYKMQKMEKKVEQYSIITYPYIFFKYLFVISKLFRGNAVILFKKRAEIAVIIEAAIEADVDGGAVI